MKKQLHELLYSVIDLRGRDGQPLLSSLIPTGSVDQNGNTVLNSNSFPASILELQDRIEKNYYSDLKHLEKDILAFVRNLESLQESHSATKITTIIKQTIKAKYEQIIAENLIKPGKRPNKSLVSSLYLEDDSSMMEDNDFINNHSFENDDLRQSLDKTVEQRAYFIQGHHDDELYKLYNKVAAKLDKTGSPLIRHFYRLPTRRKYPEYYDIIKDPISFSNIRRKMMIHKYEKLEVLKNDLIRMFNNAIEYYKEDSLIYNIAKDFCDYMNEITSGISVDRSHEEAASYSSRKRKRSSIDKNKVKKIKGTVNESEMVPEETKCSLNKYLKKVYTQMIQLKEKDQDRKICDNFLQLPSPKDYPDYYEMISNPIALKDIEKKVREKKYKHVKHFINDITNLICNARFFNKPTSQIFKDTIQIEGFLDTKFKCNIEEAINKKILNRKLPVPSADKEDKLISRLINYVSRCTDENNKRLISIANIYRPIKDIRNNLANYVSVNDLYMEILSIIKNVVDTSPKASKQRIAALTLLINCSKKIQDIVSISNIKFFILPNEINAQIFKTVEAYKDEYNIGYINSLNATTYEYKQKNDYGCVSIKTISLKSIKTDIESAYKQFNCFQSDFFSLCRAIRQKFDPTSEPFLHSIKLQQVFIGERDKILKNNVKYTTHCLDYGLDELDKEIKESVIDCPQQGGDLFSENESSSLSIVSLPFVTHSDISQALNLISSEFSIETSKKLKLVKFRELLYKPGEIVIIDHNKAKIMVLIRKLFQLPDNRKAFIGNIVQKPCDIDLCYPRSFCENELVVTPQYCICKIRWVVEKIKYVHAYHYIHYKPSDNKLSKVFFIHGMYHPSTKALSYIGTDYSHIPDGFKERKGPFSIFRSSLNVSEVDDETRVPQEKLENGEPTKSLLFTFLSDSFVPTVREEKFNFFSQIMYKNMLLRRGDFICIDTLKPIVLYQIYEIFQADKKYSLKCRKYISFNYLKISPLSMFYQKEVIQTDVYTELDIDDILVVVSVLPPTSYVKLRPTHYLEDDVYVCASKLHEATSEIVSADEFMFSNPKTFKDELCYFLEEPKYCKIFGNALQLEMDNLLSKESATESCCSDSEKSSSSAFRVDEKNESKFDLNQSSTHRARNFQCLWDQCRENLSSYSDICAHFDVYHAKEPKPDGEDNSFACQWKNCSDNQTGYSSLSRLLKHVRDAHLRLSSNQKPLKNDSSNSLFPGKENDNPLSVKEMINPLNQSFVVFRDDYLASLHRVVQMRQNDNICVKNGSNEDNLPEITEQYETSHERNAEETSEKNDFHPLSYTEEKLYHSDTYMEFLNKNYNSDASKTEEINNSIDPFRINQDHPTHTSVETIKEEA